MKSIKRINFIHPKSILKVAKDILECYTPFILLILAFASFRFIIPELSENVHYSLMPDIDRRLFGSLPTIYLQHLLWHGYVTWYDYIFYGVYASHYILPVILAWIIYKKYKQEYLSFVLTYLFATFTAFAIFIIYPTAPPWLASQDGYIPHITRISNAIFSSLGVHNFASLYNNYVPNPIAALPSLHTTYSVLFVLFINKLFGKRWTIISLIYPLCIIIGVIYMGEHYAFDVLAGAFLAICSYLFTPVIIRFFITNFSAGAVKLLFLNIAKNE